MDLTLTTGIVGSIILVVGSAYPDKKEITIPTKSTKNWLFAIGGLFMLLYAISGYLEGGSIFFIILQILVLVSSVLMMSGTSDKLDGIILSISTIILIIWTLFLSENYTIILFILGLCGIGLGYAFDMGSLRRNISLALGAIFIVLFSFLVQNWIFFWLNIFFAIFSTYYIYKYFNK